MSNLLCKLLTFAQVSEAVGLGRSTIYQRIKGGTFPRAVSLSTHCVRWRSDEIAEWINAQTTRADAVQANAERAIKASSARRQKIKPTAVALATQA
ncbi:MAG: AlpA family phage regulatory protein [Azonexus sp.]|jgi:prophage regulatory protein|nr:AlpA family phage regulatory protein [Azonexus sp.]